MLNGRRLGPRLVLRPLWAFRGPAADWLFEVEEAVTPELRLGSDSDSDSESESESEPDSDRGSVRFGPSPSLKR